MLKYKKLIYYIGRLGVGDLFNDKVQHFKYVLKY